MFLEIDFGIDVVYFVEYFTLNILNHLQYLYLQHHKLIFCHGKYYSSTGKYLFNEISLFFVSRQVALKYNTQTLFKRVTQGIVCRIQKKPASVFLNGDAQYTRNAYCE